MKTFRKLIYIIFGVLLYYLAGCGNDTPAPSKQTATQSTAGKHIGVEGRLKRVMVMGDSSFTVTSYFL